MQYEQDSLYTGTSNRQTLFVAGMPWVSRDQAVLSDQQAILNSDGVVAVDVVYPHNAAGAVGVSARRLNISEATTFAQQIPGVLSYLETQVANGGGLRNFTGPSGSVRRTWESDLRNATTLAQQVLPRIESRLQTESASGSDVAKVKAAENAVGQVARRARWQRKP